MPYKLGVDECLLFTQATEYNGRFSLLDVRLGAEQIVYDYESRAGLMAYFEQGGAFSVPGSGINKFRSVSVRHGGASDADIQEGFAALMTHENFHDFCVLRWLQQDQEPPTTETVDIRDGNE